MSKEGFDLKARLGRQLLYFFVVFSSIAKYSRQKSPKIFLLKNFSYRFCSKVVLQINVDHWYVGLLNWTVQVSLFKMTIIRVNRPWLKSFVSLVSRLGQKDERTDVRASPLCNNYYIVVLYKRLSRQGGQCSIPLEKAYMSWGYYYFG